MIGAFKTKAKLLDENVRIIEVTPEWLKKEKQKVELMLKIQELELLLNKPETRNTTEELEKNSKTIEMKQAELTTTENDLKELLLSEYPDKCEIEDEAYEKFKKFYERKTNHLNKKLKNLELEISKTTDADEWRKLNKDNIELNAKMDAQLKKLCNLVHGKENFKCEYEEIQGKVKEYMSEKENNDKKITELERKFEWMESESESEQGRGQGRGSKKAVVVNDDDEAPPIVKHKSSGPLPNSLSPTNDDSEKENSQPRPENGQIIQFGKKKFQVLSVEGDGFCLFRAVSLLLNGSSDNYRQFHEQTIDYLRNHRDEIEEFLDVEFEKHIANLSRVGWGGNDSLRALAASNNVIFHVYDWELPQAPPMVAKSPSEVKKVGRKKLVYLLIYREHYWALAKL